MTAKTSLGYVGRAAGAWLAYKRFGHMVPGGPLVAAALGWLAAGLVIDHAIPRE